MRIKQELGIAFDLEGINYIAQVDMEKNSILIENDSWETDVECDFHKEKENADGYPYLTLWGEVDSNGCPTTSGLHGLLNYDNFDIRINNENIKIIHCL